MYTVDVIIPTYKPGSELSMLIDELEKQAYRPEKIIIVNSEEVDPPIQNLDQKNQKNKNEIQIIFHKLLPSNMDLSLPLCDYCRWIASQYQIILDNKINTENDKNNFLRCIYPQDKNGVLYPSAHKVHP